MFRAGGVLVGSFAFQAYANMLGVRWASQLAMTQDLDLAGSNECMVAIPEGMKPLKDVVMASDLALFEVPMLNPRHPSTSFAIRQKQFRIDLITPLTGPDHEKPCYVSAIKSYANPLRFLDYLLEDTQKAVLLHKDGVLVNVPSPARFALHKLVVSQRRPAAEQTKASKDIRQAEPVLAALLAMRPGDIWLALEAAWAYPAPKFKKQLLKGLQRLDTTINEPILAYTQGLSGATSPDPHEPQI